MGKKYFILKKNKFLWWEWYVKVPDTFYINGEKTIEGIELEGTAYMILNKHYKGYHK